MICMNTISEVIGDGGNRYERETKFCLSVLAKPDLKLSRSNGNEHDDSEFYVLRKLYEFKCLIKGNPEPNYVTWVICNGAGNNCRYDTKNISSVSNSNNLGLHNICKRGFFPNMYVSGRFSIIFHVVFRKVIQKRILHHIGGERRKQSNLLHDWSSQQ